MEMSPEERFLVLQELVVGSVPVGEVRKDFSEDRTLELTLEGKRVGVD